MPVPPRPNLSRRTTLRRLTLGLALLGLAAACGRSRGTDAKGPTFPPYSGADALTFDDVLAPALFGFDLEARDPSLDPKLRDRSRRADYVMPARVDSLSRSGSSYELTLSATGPALAGDHAGPIVLIVPSGSPSYAWVEGAGASFAGARLIVFAKKFQDGDQQVVHFRAEPDRPEIRKAIERDAALRLLR